MTDFRNLFDIRIKNYFRHHNHIADLLSVILFDGHRDTHIRLIQYIPTEKSTALLTTNETIERTRDHLIHVMIDGKHCYVGIDHQSYNDQTMFQRIMKYDYLDYLQQYHDYQDSRGRDKIKKIITIVIYYGEKKWTGSRNYEDMTMEAPKIFEGYYNVHFMPLIEVVHLDENKFSNKDNYNLVKRLKMLYGKIAPDDDFMVSHEVACVLGALTHDEEIYNHIEKQEGDVHMGQYVLNISKKARLEGIKEGKKEGREQGLHEGITHTLLQLLQSKLGQLSPKIIHQIQTSNDEQLHALTIHIFGINSEEDVLKILKND
ncbi:MAG: Rpn family recombination-promoting nuclease/putative transposase [Massilimicrobiota sp.]|nr:Rpn family recombination-promoting nuclease/putative transposase [Massilimicrobiota sp.]